MTPKPDAYPQLLLSYYGDDFTGSTDALESVTMAGIPAMLFLEPPTKEDLAAFPHLRAVGVAGTSRSQSPVWMDTELRPILQKLKELGAPLCHYKTCSTFDSSPEIGNIGKAIEIGQDIFDAPVPVVVGVTRLRRYVVFSTLFAAASVGGESEAFRIDRHPTMSRHPSTPMNEADLRLHLARQTSRRIGSFDFRRMLKEDASEAFALECSGNDLVILDTFDDATTFKAGQLLHERSLAQPTFVVGSSGVEYALNDYLKDQGILPITAPPGPCGPVDRIVAICGSCSPTTDRQIAWAEERGFHVEAVDTVALVETGQEAEQALVEKLAALTSEHTGVLLHTARGPDDPKIAQTVAALERRGLSGADSSPIMGGSLGRVLRQVVGQTGLKRVVLAGGDSSSHAMSAMHVKSLEVAGPLVVGAPLCRIHSDDDTIDGLQVALKGGQVGADDFFERAMRGEAS
ncbi:four-carbon acid sugar kinase family protein [uncultured Cohaesibacter sp.]|uniref:four-carbon acid sugar kinase family protein n=1 Tax=uncultured Cohaesibacter sp. TaxID=1002546 RepID=UPI0029C808F2|nr:four-carbon acid sugar kinase family protein [uncultured Cohaesibacter sp.]